MYTVVRDDLEVSMQGSAKVESTAPEKHYFEEISAGHPEIYVKRINAAVGDYVEKGTVLVEASDYRGREHTIVARTDGYVRFINRSYLENQENYVSVVPFENVITVDPEVISKSSAVIKTLASDKSYDIDIGTVFTMNPGKDNAFLGCVEGISEEDGRKYYYIDLSNAPEGTKVGDTISFKYVEASSENCLVVPNDSIHQYRGKTFVYVLDSRGLKKEQYVRVGMQGILRSEIISGLEEGDKIIKG
jgi:hypothetical protein